MAGYREKGKYQVLESAVYFRYDWGCGLYMDKASRACPN